MNGGEDQGQDYQYSLSCDTGTRFKAPGDWTLPVSTCPDSPLTESPLSSSASAGICRDNSWNPFEQSFSSIQNSIDNGTFLSSSLSGDSFLGCPPNAYQPTYNSSNPQRVIPSYVTLSAINESNMFNNEYQDNDETPRPLQHTSGSSVASSSPVTPPDMEPRSRQPAWGTPKSPRRSSTSITVMRPPNSKRRKSTEASSEFTSRLRSTQFTPRPATASSSASSSEAYSGRGTRTNHNHVEKQYRNRLNGQFESLLQMLPRDENGLANEKRVSKAEVLILAKKYIEELEREKRELEEENSGLEETVTELKKRWVNLGGVCLP